MTVETLARCRSCNGHRQESLRKALKQAIVMGVRGNGDGVSIKAEE